MNADLAAISPLAAYVGSFLEAAPHWLLVVLATMILWFVLVLPPMAVVSYLDWKLGADIQMRIGPNRVSPYGILQILADVIKDFFKEDSAPGLQESLLFRWGAVAAIVCVFLAIGCIPMGENLALSNLDSGVVIVVAALGFSSLCLFWAAYSARSQWSVLASFRVLTMVCAYIVPIAVALLPPVLIAGSPNLGDVVKAQGLWPWQWIMFHDPGAFLGCATMFIALLIWEGRAPFDHAHAEAEICGGFGAEYSGMRRGLLTFLEYSSLLLSCMFLVSAYMGGWQTGTVLESFGRAANVVQFALFMSKIFLLVFLSIWIRWSLPGMRVDQILKLSWRVLVPVGLFGGALTAVWLAVASGGLFGGEGG